MLHTVTRVTGSVLWATLRLLFWLSLFPFATGWMGENYFAPLPTAFYGFVLLAAAAAYWLLQQAIIAAQGDSSVLRQAVEKDWKGKLSPFIYVLAILLTFVASWAAQLAFVFVAILWLVPDRRIERVLRHEAY